MAQLDEAAGAVLAQLDQFWAGLRETLTEEGPTGGKVEKIRRLREKALGKIEGLVKTFEQGAQKHEEELTEQLARLRQMRDQMTVIQQGVLPLFGTQPAKE